MRQGFRKGFRVTLALLCVTFVGPEPEFGEACNTPWERLRRPSRCLGTSLNACEHISTPVRMCIAEAANSSQKGFDEDAEVERMLKMAGNKSKGHLDT